MRSLLLLSVIPLFTACQSTRDDIPTSVKAPMLKDIVPREMLRCLPEPNGSHVVTARQAAIYITDLKGTGRDCRHKLTAIRGLVEGEHR